MATYGRTTMTTYKGTQDEVLVLCGDDETNVYHLNGIINVSGAYIFTVWYKSESASAITFNVFGDEETVESDSTWKKYIHRKNVTSLDNVDISITVTPDVNTYFYEAFCVNGRADTSWYPSDLDIDEDILDASKKATNYITSFNESGLWITPQNAKPNNVDEVVSGVTSGWHISGSIELFLKGVSHFWVGIQNSVAKIRLGLETAGHLLLEPTKIKLKSDSDTIVAQFSAPTSNQEEITESCDLDSGESITLNSAILYCPIPSNSEIVSVNCMLVDNVGNTYTISESATYNANDYNTIFVYEQNDNDVSIVGNGTFNMPFNGVVTVEITFNTLTSSNYIGIYPDNPDNYVFSVGIGKDDALRQNGFDVDYEGNVSASKKMYAPEGFQIPDHSSPIGTVLSKSANYSIGSNDIDVYTVGARNYIPPGTWVITGSWVFPTIQDGGPRNMTVALSTDWTTANAGMLSRNRIYAHNSAWAILDTTYIANFNRVTQVCVKGSSSISNNTVGMTTLRAIRIS